MKSSATFKSIFCYYSAISKSLLAVSELGYTQLHPEADLMPLTANSWLPCISLEFIELTECSPSLTASRDLEMVKD